MAEGCSVRLFALSTCVHCKNTRRFLEEHNVDVDCVYVDTLQGDERKQVVEEVKKHNPKLSFPTVVCANGKVVVGFREDELKEALSL